VRKLGIALLIVGIITLLQGIVMVAVASRFWTSVSGGGIWSGIFVIIAASLTMSAGGNAEARGMRIGALIMLIFAMIFTFASGIMNLIGFIVGISCSDYSNCYYDYNGNWVCNNDYYCSQDDSTVGAILSMVVSLLNFITFILSLVAAIYCGRGVCCHGNRETQGIVVAGPRHPGYGGTVVATSNYQQQPAGYPPNSGYQPPTSAPYPQGSAPSQQPAYNPNQPQYYPPQQYSQAAMPTSSGGQVTYGNDYQQQPARQEEQKVMPPQDTPPAYSRHA